MGNWTFYDCECCEWKEMAAAARWTNISLRVFAPAGLGLKSRPCCPGRFDPDERRLICIVFDFIRGVRKQKLQCK